MFVFTFYVPATDLAIEAIGFDFPTVEKEFKNTVRSTLDADSWPMADEAFERLAYEWSLSTTGMAAISHLGADFSIVTQSHASSIAVQ